MRSPVAILEIDQDQCCLTWKGTNACGTCSAAESEPCYNTWETCQARDVFLLGDPLTLRFSYRDRQTTFSHYVIPSLESIRTSPAVINVGGRRGRHKPLGIRAEINATLIDHPHSDLLVDPYVDQRDYDPMERSTFWAKWLVRNPYWIKRAMRIVEGYEDQAYEEMQVRHYVIESIEGPDSNGSVRIKGQDILRLADDETAKAPALSSGVLTSDITPDQTTIRVQGDLSEYQEYDTKAVRIADEVIRWGSIADQGGGVFDLAGCTRGTDGTEADTHDADESVQACLEYADKTPWYVMRDLLVTHGNIDESLIDFGDWEAEAEYWLEGFTVTRILTEPVGVTTLLGELVEQTLCYIWHDEIQQKISFRAVAPEFGEVPLITYKNNIIKGSTKPQTRPEARASEVWLSYLPKDVTELEDRRDYQRTILFADGVDPREWGERRPYEVMASWLPAKEGPAIITAAKMLLRYRRPDYNVKLKLHTKDRDIVGLGKVVDLEIPGLVDFTGGLRRERYQVISLHESPIGEQIKVELQRYDFDARRRYAKWMVEQAPDYLDATEEQKSTGAFWANDDGLMSNGDNGYGWV